jgi:hypothetical protein
MATNAADSQAATQTQAQNRGNNRSMMSSITSRIAGMRGNEREAQRAREDEGSNSRRANLLRELNRLQDMALGRTQFNNGRGSVETADVEAQNTTNGSITDANSRRSNSTGVKTRREKEEGAALFGPNLANYFGSGSSSSGAVASLSGDFGLNAASAAQKKSRLGSRGRARGASLSGLLPDELAAQSLSDEIAKGGSTTGEQMPMAEGIQLDTIKKWIDRSVSGGALEIPGVEGATGVPESEGNPLALCSTLQSYVNLKRNTVKLNLVSDAEESLHARSATANSFSSFGIAGPSPTHLLQFEYDCAAPNAIIQVFARASRKHGSWATWTASRDAAGLPADASLESDEDGRFYAQRGPPPHILGWPVYASRLKRGFGKPLKAAIALQLDLYAPGKFDSADKKNDETSREPETPGLDVGKQLGDDAAVTPAVTTVPVQDPLANYNTVLPISESKDAKAAREKAERETLKVTLVVEALDEDGKPLGEPNLQTTYLRLASLPMRVDQRNQAFVDASNVVGEGQVGGHVQDIAVPAEEDEGREVLAGTTTDTQQTTKRVWSLQVEGQEAEIGPHRFQLQELYGLSSRPPPPDQEEHHGLEATEGADGVEGEATTPAVDLTHMQDGNAGECLICLSSPPTTLLLPCTHGLCLECAVQLRESVKAVRQTERRRGRRPKRKYACPVCRRAYTNMLYLSTADEKKAAQAAASEI